MRQLLCTECGSRYKPGRYCLQPATMEGPAEWVRVVKGPAAMPTREQMTIYVNGEPEYLDPTTYLCDLCNTSVAPGDPAVAVSLWFGDAYSRGEPVPWEQDYIQGSQIPSNE